MSELNRRDALGLLGLATTIGLTGCTAREVEKAAAKVETAAKPFVPQFFTPDEWRTVNVLTDIVIPKDGRSGSATDAGVPAFMDFIMSDAASGQDRMRSGLSWLAAESARRFQTLFADLTPEQQLAIVNDSAWPEKAPEGLKEGTQFFSYFRNLCASGFWSSRMGIEDLGYKGNVFNPNWNGCPDPQLHKLGVSRS